MIKKNIVLVLVLFAGLCQAQKVKYKMIYMQSPAIGRYMLHILPWGYDTTITPEQIAKCVDTLPGHFLSAKMYNLVYKDDTTKLAAKIEEAVYVFHKKITLVIYWKNGNKMHYILLNKHHEKYWEFSYHDNDAPAECGKYKKGHKKGRWVYFNTQGLKIRVEKYAKDGTLKKTKNFDPPKKTGRTIFNPRHLGGTPYIIAQ